MVFRMFGLSTIFHTHPKSDWLRLSPSVPPWILIKSLANCSIWRFLKLGTPVHHPFPDGFSIVNHPAIWGYPPFTDTQGLELGDPTHHPEASELSSGSRRPTGSCISLASPAKREGFEKSTSLDIKVQIWKSFAFRNWFCQILSSEEAATQSKHLRLRLPMAWSDVQQVLAMRLGYSRNWGCNEDILDIVETLVTSWIWQGCKGGAIGYNHREMDIIEIGYPNHGYKTK